MVNWFQKMIVPNMMFNMNSKPACSLILFFFLNTCMRILPDLIQSNSYMY